MKKIIMIIKIIIIISIMLEIEQKHNKIHKKKLR